MDTPDTEPSILASAKLPHAHAPTTPSPNPWTRPQGPLFYQLYQPHGDYGDPFPEFIQYEPNPLNRIDSFITTHGSNLTQEKRSIFRQMAAANRIPVYNQTAFTMEHYAQLHGLCSREANIWITAFVTASAKPGKKKETFLKYPGFTKNSYLSNRKVAFHCLLDRCPRPEETIKPLTRSGLVNTALTLAVFALEEGISFHLIQHLLERGYGPRAKQIVEEAAAKSPKWKHSLCRMFSFWIYSLSHTAS